MSAVLDLLAAELADRVDTDPASLDAARADKSGHAAAGSPVAIVHAASVADVQATCQQALAQGAELGVDQPGGLLTLCPQLPAQAALAQLRLYL